MTTTDVKDKVDLAEVVDWAAAEAARGDASQWDQGVYLSWQRLNGHCGTRCCIAGRAVLQAGYEPALVRPSPGEASLWRAINEPYQGDDAFVHGAFVVRPGDDPFDTGNWIVIGDLAAELLDLTDDDAADLFHGINDLAEVRRVAARIIAERGENQ